MHLPPISRRIVGQVLIDAALVIAANFASFVLKYGPPVLHLSDPHLHTLLLTLPILIGLRVSAFGLFRLYRIRWRYMSVHDLKTVAGATTLSTLLFYGFLVVMGYGAPPTYSWTMQVIDWIVTICLLSGVRISYRLWSDKTLEAPLRTRQRALIVGAGDAGEAVARDLLRRPADGIIPIGFVDDEPRRRGTRIHGLPVLGTTQDIAALAQKVGVELILIAIPRAAGKTIRDIVARCEAVPARLCLVPGLTDLIEGSSATGISSLTSIRAIKIEDLLRREPVQTDMAEIAGYLSGQRVLVTGAGGSIGSELCRQIAGLNPARLLLLGRGENSIFEIEQELIRDFGIAPTAIIADVKDRDRLEEVFLAERPTVVFHAAAHKHVPLMETSPSEAIKNNVLGTRNVAEVAAACGVRKLVYVSTDKAVNPESVMGATKRIGEQIVSSLAHQHHSTEFAIVRFGNVLGSRGSVVPTMQKQIARGGPVTVTDPNMTRYFMTIPEAVQLILQAGAMGKHGETFLLDMGEPVRILDLARDLIRLSGLRPDVDIKIEFTGVRPGEKINEELHYASEARRPTAHTKICVSESDAAPPLLLSAVDRLIRLACEGERDRLRDEILKVARGEVAGGEPIFASGTVRV
ncbi:nucleoside-diphosphate sugar epimerase/dehydratase [Armatimonas sp.]|uniref:polysaccharide biosynthesis protein n=1 Tax=Armatimonas sp. TaxID=1872638 RepID=UPI00286D075C|nr:nucleoside-diphosphate sugar epimerase/dehydratase [Armatimonas sp.]